MSSGLVNMLPTNNSFTNYIYIYIYEHGLALNNLQKLICNKKQSNNNYSREMYESNSWPSSYG